MRKKDSLFQAVLLQIILWCLLNQASAGVYIDIDELTAELESSIKSESSNNFRTPAKNHWDQIAQALIPKNSNFDSIPAESHNFETSPPPNNGWIIWPDSKGGLKYKKIPNPQSNYQKKKNNVPIFSTISEQNSEQNSQEVAGTSYFPQYSTSWGNGGKEAGNMKNGLSDGYHYDEYNEEFSDEAWKLSQKKKRKKKGKGKRRRNRNRSKNRWQNNGGKVKKSRTKYFNEDDGYRRNTPNVRLTYSRKKKPVGWMKLLPKSWFN